MVCAETVEALETKGFSVVSAHGVEDGKIALGTWPSISVLLTDLNLSGENGLQLGAWALGERDAAHALEVILFTGYGNFETAIQALRTRVFAFLRKPVSIREIIDAVTRASDAAKARRQKAMPSAIIPRQIADEVERIGRDLWKRLAPASSGCGQEHRQTLMLMTDALRNAMAQIVGLSEMLDRPDSALPPATVAHFAHDIRVAGEQLSLLIHAMTLLSGLIAGTRVNTATPVQAAALIDGLSPLPCFEGPDAIRLHNTVPPDGPSVLLDREIATVILRLFATALAGTTLPDGNVIQAEASRAGERVLLVLGAAGRTIPLRGFNRPEHGDAAMTEDAVRRLETVPFPLWLAQRLALAVNLTAQATAGDGGTALTLVCPAA